MALPAGVASQLQPGRLPLPPRAHHPNTAEPGAGSPPTPLRRHNTRRAALAALASALLTQKPARSFEFGFTTPDQTIEEAEAGVKVHSRGLLQLRPLVESQAWRELQLALRESSPRLKQDLYTIIQSKPGEQRPVLRRLYSNLFNSVTRLDYAARSKDENLVRDHYQRAVATLEDILGRI